MNMDGCFLPHGDSQFLFLFSTQFIQLETLAWKGLDWYITLEIISSQKTVVLYLEHAEENNCLIILMSWAWIANSSRYCGRTLDGSGNTLRSSTVFIYWILSPSNTNAYCVDCGTRLLLLHWDVAGKPVLVNFTQIFTSSSSDTELPPPVLFAVTLLSCLCLQCSAASELLLTRLHLLPLPMYWWFFAGI